jgi:pyruvate dehydrogenase E1 component
MPEGVEEGIIKGMYLFQKANKVHSSHVQLLGCGSILHEVIAASELLQQFEISSDIWSVTSFTELRKEALSYDRWNQLHPLEKPRQSYVQSCLANTQGPIIAATDYMKIFAQQIMPFIERPFIALGTDGFGRSDTREKLRNHFEVDRYYIAYSAIKALVDDGKLKPDVAANAMRQFNINPEKIDPAYS